VKRIGKLPFLLSGGGWVLCLLFSVSFAVSVGSADVGGWTVWKVITVKLGLYGPDPALDEATVAIVWELRLPRVLLSALVGAMLSVAGAVYQGVLRNTLADPYILGISSGSALGAVLFFLTGWGEAPFGVWALPFFAFVGACLAFMLVLRLARSRAAAAPESLILSGVVVQAFFAALLAFALSMVPSELQRIQFWMLGSFTLRQWEHVAAATPFFLAGLSACWLLSRELNLFSLGDRPATHLGVRVGLMRILLLTAASLMTAAAVSVSGMIGFVGLVVPHAVRMLSGADYRVLLPLSALAGGVFLIWADVLCRVAMDPVELPIGVITALVGAPFFAVILRKHLRRFGG
jgi:iron complex transport system permease protein